MSQQLAESKHALLPVVGLAALVGAVCAALAIRPGFIDLDVYRWAGKQLSLGASLYVGGAPDTGLPFTYPPFAALPMVAWACLPKTLAVGLWTALSVWALGVVIWVVLRQARVAVSPTTLVWLVLGSMTFYPVWLTLAFGQVNLFLMALVCWDVLACRARHSGWLVGLAAGLKLTPLIFVGFLVLVGRRSAALRAVAGFLLTIAVGFVVLPGASTAFWGGVGFDAARTGGLMYASNQSLRGVLIRLWGAEPPGIFWVASVVCALALCFTAAVLAWRAGHHSLGLCLAAVGGLLASPVSWAHHWVWMVPLVLSLALAGWRKVACVVAVPIVLTTIMWPPNRQRQELQWTVAEQVLGNLWAVTALLLTAWVLWRLWPTRSPQGQDRAGAIRPETSPSVIRAPSAPTAE